MGKCRSPKTWAGDGALGLPGTGTGWPGARTGPAAAPAGSGATYRVKNGSMNERSSTSTVSDSQTRRSAWLVP